MRIGHFARRRRAQIVSLDLVGGVILFVIFLAIFISLILLLPRHDRRSEFEFEMLYVFDNLETGLKSVPANQDFYDAYRVNATALANFAAANAGSDIDDYLIGALGTAHGVGLSPDGYDLCLYFTDNDLTPVSFGSGDVAMGKLRTGTCDEKISAGLNPCAGYRRAMSVFRPVLYDEGSASENRVLQMNVVACRVI